MGKNSSRIKKIIVQATQRLKEYFTIDEIILFGSQVTGKIHEFSDIDLAVISPDFKKKKFDELISIFARISFLSGNNIEIHPFSREALKEARPTNFLGHILKTGRIVYKAGTVY